jgi:glycerol kinase
MTKYFMGIDQGTTGTTVLLIDENWNVVSRGYREHSQIYPRPGWVEHNPIEIFNNCQQAAKMAIDRCIGFRTSDIVSLGICNQGETCMIWEKDTGKPLYNAIVWQDRRTADTADKLGHDYGEYIREKTGLIADSYYSATKLKWLLDNVESAREKAVRGELLAGTLDSWLIWKFTGGSAHITDACTAGRTMLIDIKTSQWDQTLLGLLDIPRSILPPIMNCSEVYGYTTPDTFFGERVPVGASLSDAQAALFAQGCYDPGSVKTTYGTGCFMNLITGRIPVLSSNGLTTACSWKLNNERTYSLGGSVYVAGAAIQWLRDGLKIIETASQTQEMARSVSDTAGVFFVPAFSGLAAPYWDQYARGTIIGLTGGVKREHIVRATLESIAFQVCDNMAVMKQDSNLPIAMMKADGGLVENEFLMQFQADLLNIPVEVPTEKETSAYGAALLAALAIGEFSSPRDVKGCLKLLKRYEPQMSEDERHYRISEWHRAVKRSRNWIQA